MKVRKTQSTNKMPQKAELKKQSMTRILTNKLNMTNLRNKSNKKFPVSLFLSRIANSPKVNNNTQSNKSKKTHWDTVLKAES